MERRSGVESNGRVDGSSMDYGAGIERILRLFIVLMVKFEGSF